MKELYIKELSLLLFSRKYIIFFIIVQILLLLGFASGIERYSSSYELAVRNNQLSKDSLANASNPNELRWNNSIHRTPSIMTVFDSGIDNAIGRAGRTGRGSANLSDPIYVEFPLLYLFRNLDLTVIFTVVGSLIAFIFTFTSISGEKEGGTLKLILLGKVSRTSVVMAKIFGIYSGLVLIFIPALLIGLIVLLTFAGIQITSVAWMQTGLIIISYFIYLFIIVCLGVAISGLCKRNFTSLLYSLGAWILFVLLLPQMTVGLADIISPQEDALELRKKIYSIWNSVDEDEIVARKMEEHLKNNNIVYTDFNEDKWDIEDVFRNEIMAEQDKKFRELMNEYEKKDMANYRMVQNLSIISPAALTQHFAHAISNTDYQLMVDFKESLVDHGTSLDTFINELKEEYGSNSSFWKNQQRITYERKDNSYLIIENPDYKPFKVDVSGFPEFRLSRTQIWQKTDELFFFITVLIAYAAVAFSLAWIVFLRYDPR
jgi:ABC-2 type transport system permease protein